MGRWGIALEPSVIREVHDRIVQIVRTKGVVKGRRMRVDTTVVERDIHYPTDSSLLCDGVPVLTRAMKHITKLAVGAGTQLRDPRRSVQYRLLEFAQRPAAKPQRKTR